MLRVNVLLIALILGGCATGSRMQDDIDPLFRLYAGNVPGASVIVVRDGRTIFRKAYGLANLEEQTAATPATHYRLASVTKQFTAAAILLLADEGRLTLDDPIRRWLPSLPPYADAITIRHVLTHTSGLLAYEDLIAADATVAVTDAGVLKLVETQSSTYFAPGTSYRYSNTGYAFLALIVEKASGRRFAEFLRDTIFLPLGMTTTVAHEEGISTVMNRAFGYSRDGTSWRRTDQSLTSAVLGDGGIYASVDDLAAWVNALDRGFAAQASLPRVETGKPGERYGFGWRVSEHEGRRAVWHTGESIGFRNAVVRFPDEHFSVVVLTNRSEGKPYDIAMAIADRMK